MNIEEILKGVNFHKEFTGGGTTHYGQESWSVRGFVRKFVKCTIATSVEGNECYFFNFGMEYRYCQVWDRSGSYRSPLKYFKAEAGNKGWVKKDVDAALEKEGGLKENRLYGIWYLYHTMNSEYQNIDNMKEWKDFVLRIFPDYVFDDAETLKEKARLKEEYATMQSYLRNAKSKNSSSELTVGNAITEMARQYEIKYGESITL